MSDLVAYIPRQDQGIIFPSVYEITGITTLSSIMYETIFNQQKWRKRILVKQASLGGRINLPLRILRIYGVGPFYQDSRCNLPLDGTQQQCACYLIRLIMIGMNRQYMANYMQH